MQKNFSHCQAAFQQIPNLYDTDTKQKEMIKPELPFPSELMSSWKRSHISLREQTAVGAV